LTMTMANNRQKFYALAIYWLRDYSRNFGVETLAENLVFALYGHKAGVLWAGTGVGLEKFDPTTLTFQHYVPIHRVPKNMPATMLLQFVKTTMVSFGLGLHGACINLTKQQAHSQLCDVIQQIPGAYSTTG